MKLLTEIERIQSIMGVIKEDEETNLQMNINLGKTVEILKYLRLYNKSIEKMLMEITVLSKNQIIDLGISGVLMSGSGATVFAISKDKNKLKEIMDVFNDYYFKKLTKIR